MAADERLTRDEIATKVAELKRELQAHEEEWAGKRFDEDAALEYNRLNTDIDDLSELDAQLKRREDRLKELAGEEKNIERIEVPQSRRPGAVSGEDIWDLSTIERAWDNPQHEARQLHDRALRAVEQAKFSDPRVNREDAQGRIERLLSDGEDRRGADVARHVLATGSREYKRAFTKYLAQEPRTQQEEVLLHRAMSLTGASGGFAVPFVLDPSVIQTGSGAINPYRSVGSVLPITVDEWRGVSSTGITATFQAEASAVTDASPTLAQPTVSTEMARAFVPFSIEIGMDWGAFESEMATMVGDSKDVLEASKMATGTGTNEPFGVITGATTVFTASNTNSLVVADIYGVHNALGPRFRRNASWTLNNAVADRIRQLDTAGGANLWVDNLQLRSAAVPNGFQDGRMGANLLGKPAYEATGQSGTFTTGQLIGVVGDFSYYKIIDRIGVSIEIIPHIFGAAQGNLPTGQRGMFAYWRVGAKVLDANAFRTLKLA